MLTDERYHFIWHFFCMIPTASIRMKNMFTTRHRVTYTIACLDITFWVVLLHSGMSRFFFRISNFDPKFRCQAIFAQAKFARPSLPGPILPSQVCPKSKFVQSQICPNPNLPGPIFAPAKFAQTHFCPEMNLATFHLKVAKFQVKLKKEIEKCYYL